MTGGAEAYTYLGTASYVKHEGSRPMNITWKLDRPIPAKFLKKTNKLALCISVPFTVHSDLPTRLSCKAAFLISLFLVLYFCLVSVVFAYGAALFGTFVRAKEF